MGVAAFGVAVSIFWLSSSRSGAYLYTHADRAALCLAELVVLTTFNISLRWLRWHFLCRHFRLRLPAKESLRLYIATLPAIITPFYVGELARGVVLAGRRAAGWGQVFGIWVFERAADVIVLVLFLLSAMGWWAWVLALLGALAVVSLLAGSLSDNLTARTLFGWKVLLPVLVDTLLAWGLSVVGLWIALVLLGKVTTIAAAGKAFASGTLLGGVSGIPFGTGVTGSTAIVSLEASGVPPNVATVAVAVLRAGTAWYALGLGILALVAWRRHLLRLTRSDVAAHFDELAQDYPDQIPSHVRDRLLSRKIAVMAKVLAEGGPEGGVQGLDIGCGQGWYACEMARLGYRISGCDLSAGQIDRARAYAERKGVRVEFQVAAASRLPYGDGTFDFAYAINVFHHITTPQAHRQAFLEVVRVLKPGGLFFLHEINTQNVLFRLYVGYFFPLLRDIDDGTELWISPPALPEVEGATWRPEISYLTFLPDFAPRWLLRMLGGIERRLEESRLRRWSAHYAAVLVRNKAEPETKTPPSARPH